MGEGHLNVVEVPGAIELSREQVGLSAGGFAALDLAVPDDFTRPGARAQLLLTDGQSHAIGTVAAVLPDVGPDDAVIAMGDPDRLFADAAPSATRRRDDGFVRRSTVRRDGDDRRRRRCDRSARRCHRTSYGRTGRRDR